MASKAISHIIDAHHDATKTGQDSSPLPLAQGTQKNNNALLAELGKAWVPAFASDSCLTSITLIQGQACMSRLWSSTIWVFGGKNRGRLFHAWGW